MGAIVIGIILMIISVNIDLKLEEKKHMEEEAWFSTISGCIFAGCILIGLFWPTKFGEWELVNEANLISLSGETEIEAGEEPLYASVDEENVYTYRHEISSEFGTETSTEYEADTVSGDVIESEDPNCKSPVLLEYKRKAKPTIWTFGVWASETKYVFYVPEGTIQDQVKLDKMALKKMAKAIFFVWRFYSPNIFLISSNLLTFCVVVLIKGSSVTISSFIDL